LTDKRYICGGQVPPDLLAWITSQRGDLKTKINQCELLAFVAAVMTFPDILLKRDVVSWVDNTTALSSVCNYNRTPLFCCQVAWCFFAVTQEHYVDDYCTPDFKIADAPDCGAATALSALHDILGLQLTNINRRPTSKFSSAYTATLRTSQILYPMLSFRPQLAAQTSLTKCSTTLANKFLKELCFFLI